MAQFPGQSAFSKHFETFHFHWPERWQFEMNAEHLSPKRTFNYAPATALPASRHKSRLGLSMPPQGRRDRKIT